MRRSFGRLTSFDIKEAGGNRIIKHEWQYDSLGRKSAAAGITVTGPNDYGWDAYDRLTSATQIWSGGAAAIGFKMMIEQVNRF